MANVGGAFCIDRWEASLVEVTPDGERPFSPYESVEKRVVRAVAREGFVPQAYISRDEAEAACRASRKRLCHESEWQKACKGNKNTTYPYGNDRASGYCNDDGVSPLKTLFDGKGVNMYSRESMSDSRLNRVPGTLSKTGSHSRCTNGYGVFDMVGNLHEWVDDAEGTFRGGYYLDTKLNGPGCNYRTTAHNATYHDYSTGFRCCAAIGRSP
jgi:formylglycine-generating enzyme